VRAIVPQNMDDAWRIAKAVCAAGMAPNGLGTPEKAMIAIMHGLEIGLTPLMALQRIAVVNGRPTLWGDGAMALVRASGLATYVKEWIEGEGDARVAYCSTVRKGETAVETRSFSVADAKKAGLWGKSGPWQQYPTRMLQMRARAFLLRDVYADAMGGMYLREELEDDAGSAPARVEPPAPIETLGSWTQLEQPQQVEVVAKIAAPVEPPMPIEPPAPVAEPLPIEGMEPPLPIEVEWNEDGEVVK
jgi:hypothetical protein